MPQSIPLLTVPAQELTVVLGGQVCQLKVYQKSTGLYMDVSVSNVLLVAGVICQNNNRIVRESYIGFLGDLAFFDTQGDDDPNYLGLGPADDARWALLYYSPAELGAG